MANTSVGYKCPNCGGPLAFAPGSEKVTCPYCDTEFEVAKIEELFAKQEKLAAEARRRKKPSGIRPMPAVNGAKTKQPDADLHLFLLWR